MPQARTDGQTKSRISSRGTPAMDAIEFLKADHREVEALFEKFKNTESAPQKRKLAAHICKTLRVHTQIEEEVFYPACREAGISEDMMDEADVEHDAARRLVEQIEAGGPGDEHWDARVTVLSEMIKHHVKEEEQREGMFARAKKSDLDLDKLGAELKARKTELMKKN